MSLIQSCKNSEGEGNTKKKVLPYHEVLQARRIQATVVNKHTESVLFSITSKGDAAG